MNLKTIVPLFAALGSIAACGGSGTAAPNVRHVGNVSWKHACVLALLLTVSALRPPGDSAVAFNEGVSSTGWIEFEPYRGQIFVPVKVNGHDAMAYLINGISSKIDKGFANSIGMDVKTDTAATVQVQIGALTLRDLNAGVSSFTGYAARVGHPMTFWLGDELFKTMAVDIDFAHRRLAISDPAKQSIPAGARRLPLTETAGKRTVPVSADGGAPGQFALWLGNAGDMLVFQSYYETHGLLQGRRTSQRLAGGVNALNAETVATLNRVRFAGADLPEMTAAFVPDSISKVDSKLISGGLGIPMLSRFRLIIDYSQQRVYALPDPNAIGAPFEKDRLGLVLAKLDGGFEVRFVSPDSPAKAAGFKIGDKIALIDGKAAGEWANGALAGLRFATARTSFAFTMADSSVRQVKAAEFF